MSISVARHSAAKQRVLSLPRQPQFDGKKHEWPSVWVNGRSVAPGETKLKVYTTATHEGNCWLYAEIPFVSPFALAVSNMTRSRMNKNCCTDLYPWRNVQTRGSDSRQGHRCIEQSSWLAYHSSSLERNMCLQIGNLSASILDSALSYHWMQRNRCFTWSHSTTDQELFRQEAYNDANSAVHLWNCHVWSRSFRAICSCLACMEIAVCAAWLQKVARTCASSDEQ